MTILADMRAALDEAAKLPLRKRLAGEPFWRIGNGSKSALYADLSEAGAGVAQWTGQHELDKLLGFPIEWTADFDGWELCRGED